MSPPSASSPLPTASAPPPPPPPSSGSAPNNNPTPPATPDADVVIAPAQQALLQETSSAASTPSAPGPSSPHAQPKKRKRTATQGQPAAAADDSTTEPPAKMAATPKTASEPTQSAAYGHKILRELLQSNRSYTAGDSKAQSELSSPALRTDLAEHGQKPVAAIIACADSRVAPEIVFGVGLGQVFVIRNAGNAAWGDSVIGSLEYAVANLGVPLVMVLGHSLCGAITAAVGAAKEGASMARVDSVEDPLSKHVYRLADIVKSEIGKPEAVKVSVIKNVRAGVQALKEGKTKVAEFAAQQKIAVVGAVYDLHSGEVVVVQE